MRCGFAGAVGRFLGVGYGEAQRTWFLGAGSQLAAAAAAAAAATAVVVVISREGRMCGPLALSCCVGCVSS
jgi:hypothetical protein